MNNPNNQSEQSQGQGMNSSGMRNNNPMEQASQKSQRGFSRNPYVDQTMGQDRPGQNPYYDNMNNMNNVDNMPNQMSQNFGQNPYFGNVNAMPQQQNNSSLLGSFDTENFIKGALIGAIGAYLLTNEKAQKTIFKGVVKTTGMFQAGMEEMKERFEDAKAELDAES